ncbi:helix-turn-helix transcriptional regulator [Cohnella hongkongensis]|uniref:Helix-turn-helix transcriptional regulator n=1 Tax=Cohnella hongkongensis TaxID=178337 RepID=A0ABV9FAZ9_9BACL
MELGRIRRSLLQLVDCCEGGSRTNRRALTGKELVVRVKQYVQDHCATASLEEISQRYFINKYYFCALFKNETGEGFHDYLTAARMEKAKALLSDSHLKTYEIAECVGFKDQRYFSQVFRKHTGMQPGTYRKSARGGSEKEKTNFDDREDKK